MRYSDFKINLVEAILDEVEMSPRALQDFLASPESQGMKMGFELEMVVPGAKSEGESDDGDQDYSYDELTSDIENIVNFYDDGEYNSRESIRILRNRLMDEYLEWQDGAFDDWLDTDAGKTAFAEELRGILNNKLDTDEEQEIAYNDVMNNKAGRQFDNDANDEIYLATMEALRDDFNDNDGSEQDWLSATRLNYMTDVEDEYDMTWPHWEYGYGESYLNVDYITDDFTEHTGLKAKGYDGYHSGSRSGQVNQGYWIIEPDSSIDAEDDGEAGLEFISPPLELPQAFEQLKLALAWADDHGCTTNDSTGFHINVSVPGLTEANTDYVKLALFLGDKHILEQFDRLSNSYCRSALDKISRRSGTIQPEGMDNIMANLRQGLNKEASTLIHGWSTEKYTSINTKSNYVEFRGPGGNYLDEDVDKLVNTALRTAYALKIANDPTAYKKEYMKKFYKVITDQKQKDDVQKFNQYIAMYQAGSKEERQKVLSYIRNNIEFRRELKKEVPTKEKEQYWVMNKDGTGGKQMVFARSKSEAIDTGGKNMGYNQDYSRANLTAVKKTDTLRRYTVTSKLDPEQSVEILAQEIDSAVVIGADKLGVSANDVTAISSDTSKEGQEEISYEIKNVDTGASFERIPSSLNLTRQEIEGRRRHWARQSNLPDHTIVIDPPLPTDSDDRRFHMFTVREINGADRGESWSVSAEDAVQARNIISQREGIPLHRLVADSLTSASPKQQSNAEIAQTLPQSWKDWILNQLPYLNVSTIESVKDRVTNGIYSDDDLLRDQRTWLMLRMAQEIDFRNNADSQAPEPEPAAPRADKKYKVVVKNSDIVVLTIDAADLASAKAKAQEWFTATHSDPDSYYVELAQP